VIFCTPLPFTLNTAHELLQDKVFAGKYVRLLVFDLTPHALAARKISDNIRGLRSQDKQKEQLSLLVVKKGNPSPHIGYCSRQFIVRFFKGTG
jgi:hypothetical protein